MRNSRCSVLRLAALLWVGSFLFTAMTASAEVFKPLIQSKYRCSQTGTSSENPVGRMTLRHKRAGQTIAGKKSWSYSALQKRLRALSKSRSPLDRRNYSELSRARAALLSCFDAKSLPRPDGSTPPLPTPTPTPPGGIVAFSMVQPIIQANCMGCHAARGWTNSESFFLQQGLVLAGDPIQSTLYRSLRENPESLGPANMPSGGTALSLSQISLIRSWIEDIGHEGGAPDEERFTCLPTMHVATSKMKRLSKAQFANSLIDLAQIIYPNRQTAKLLAWDYAWWYRERFPDDFSPLGHARLDDRLDEAYIEAAFGIVESFADHVAPADRLLQVAQAFVPTCTASNYLTEPCRNEFLRQFGRRVLKGTLSAADYDFYRRPNTSGQSQASYREMIIRLLSSPRFLYHLESGGTPVDSTGLLVRISPNEFISRLAYTLWNTLPDDQLIRYAEDGTVDRDPAAVVAYALDQQSSKGREAIKEFFDGWLKLRHTLNEIALYFEVDAIVAPLLQVNYGTSEPPLVDDPTNYEATRQALLGYRNDAEEEVKEIGALLTFERNAPVSELFTTRIAPVRNETLRRSYNLPAVWDGNAQTVPETAAVRQGILARAAFHLSRGGRNRIIIRGRRIREDVLCDPTGLPANNSTPAGLNTQAFEYHTGATQYQIRALTEQQNTTCIGCHQRWLNPLGFALEDFDPMGRRRNGEEVVVTSFNGNPLQEYRRSYDTTVTPFVNRQDASPVTGAAGLGERIAQSDEMHACFTRNLVRYVFHRPEVEAGDGCFMNSIFEDSKNLPMKEVLRRLFLSPTFRYRRLNEAYVP